jgi:hypothetical protein
MELIKKTRYLLILVFFAGINILAVAQNITFTATAPKVVEIGEQNSITYALNAKGSNIEDPSIDNFRNLSGPKVSSSSTYTPVDLKLCANASVIFKVLCEYFEH